MSLTPGTRIGVYAITAQIGEGGMGQVYRATDTKLKRQVAIKILPSSLAADADRLARFQREAEVLASLNHPNIAAIYGLEESDDITALVMELVDGDDLSERIARGAIPIDEALPIAKQIAEALEAAHEQGIIHRDLKPANIKVRADGTVKVLDFGLAKAFDRAGESGRPGGHDLSASPTLTSPAMTQAGIVLGTAPYMSPEQAKGRPVDRRADIWAFGAVLFEMLAGTRAFSGEDITDTIVSVMSKEPDFGLLPATVPARVAQALRVCLRKDANQRAHDMADVRLALEGAFETTASESSETRTASSRGRLPLIAALAAVAALAIAFAIPAVRHLREAPPVVAPETRVEINTPGAGDATSFALSPDGRQIVFVASADGPARLWLRSLNATMAQPLTGTDGAAQPFWSPDSRSIAFFADGQLKRLDLGGGALRSLAPIDVSRGGSWNADGVMLISPSTAGPLFRVAATGGDLVPVTTLDRQASHRWPLFLPDGRHFLFYAQGGTETSGLYLGALDGSAATRVTATEAGAAYLPSVPEVGGAGRQNGWLVWVRAGGTLTAQRLDLNRRTLTGDVVTLADSVAFDGTSNASAVSASATGLLAYRAANTRRQLTWVDRTGKALSTLGADDSRLQYPQVASNGRSIAVSRTLQGNTDIWLLDGIRTNRLTFDPGADRDPIWSPDGGRIVFDSTRISGVRQLFVKDVAGAGTETLLVDSPQLKVPTDWSPDGRYLLYHSVDPTTLPDLWIKPMTGNEPPWILLKTPFRELSGRFSPDGHWVAYNSNESGRMEIYVRPFAPPSPGTAPGPEVNTTRGQRQVSTSGGIYATWRADGRELYYLGPRGEMMAVPITVRGAALEPGTPVALFPTRVLGGGLDQQQERQYDVGRDGRFLINTVPDDATAAPITLIQNWTPEAKK